MSANIVNKLVTIFCRKFIKMSPPSLKKVKKNLLPFRILGSEYMQKVHSIKLLRRRRSKKRERRDIF